MNGVAVALLAQEDQPLNVLEYSFLALLGLMTLVIGLLALVVVSRIVEPRGMRALLRRLLGRA